MNAPSNTSKMTQFFRLEDCAPEESILLRDLAKPFKDATADRVLRHLDLLRDAYPGYQVDRYTHSLQTATRAFRDGADDETVVAALLHDIGDTLAAHNHPELAATILRPYVKPDTHWIVAKHGIFEGYFYFHHYGRDRFEREKYRGHPAFEKAVEFCLKWDQASFDPTYDTMPVSEFVGAVHRVFGREPWSLGSAD